MAIAQIQCGGKSCNLRYFILPLLKNVEYVGGGFTIWGPTVGFMKCKQALKKSGANNNIKQFNFFQKHHWKSSCHVFHLEKVEHES